MSEPTTVKITKAEKRLDEGWHRTFVVADGTEFLLPISKPDFLAQGFNAAPERWPEHGLDTVQLWTEITDENSEVAEYQGITDPIIVGLAIASAKAGAVETTLDIPTAEQGQQAIDSLRSELLQA